MRQRPTLLVPILEMWRRLFKVAAQMLETEFQDVDVPRTCVGLSGVTSKCFSRRAHKKLLSIQPRHDQFWAREPNDVNSVLCGTRRLEGDSKSYPSSEGASHKRESARDGWSISQKWSC